ncbi:DUF4124 domain-containing protein [Thalassotalea marina]|uniref:DUF4124 domain-containing protein n=1 Tax=Thalassotalea marina TaxID=1673741 RepID=A0A919BQA2_9GAMM|nr:DUF4124 domain-containing protein [Thalassotalea marina]GHG02364.1 hypothetical protein GCM10017161_34020 [Thalassotalea marina]
MQKTIASLLTIYFVTSAVAQNVTVYRWVDKNNVVHFSQHQPNHNDYTELSLSVFNKTNTKLPKDDKSPAASGNSKGTQGNVNTNSTKVDATKSKCDEAKANVATLKNHDNIQYTDENGQVQVLTELEKKQQLAINEKQVEVYCDI